jgi:chromosome partitioning protein
MRRIAVVNMKGGVGKTTTAVHVAAGFARLGQRVLLVDADPQGNVGHVFDLHPTRTIRDLMLGDAAAADVIIRDIRPGLDAILAAPSSFGLDAQLAGAVQRETILARRLADLASYDVIVVDTSPSMGLLTYNALLFATEVIVPVGMDSLAITGMRQTLDGVREIRSLWPGRELNLLAVLPTAANPQTYATRAAIAALEEDPEAGPRLFPAGIRQCIDLTYAAAAHQTIWEYAPKSRAAEDFTAFLEFADASTQRAAGAA